MGLLCCEVFIRSPTQRSGWACMFSVKAHGLRSMGLLCCEVFIRSPTQRSGWAYMFSVYGQGLEDFLKPICTQRIQG